MKNLFIYFALFILVCSISLNTQSKNFEITDNKKIFNKSQSLNYDFEADKQAFLEIHNRERKTLGVEPLEWDYNLARIASDYARKLHSMNRLQHSNSEYGENLFWGSDESFTMADAAKSWLSEKKYLKSNYYEPKAGHYTQMIWQKTKRVGAGIYRGKNGTYVVANYDPPGNIIGKPIISK